MWQASLMRHRFALAVCAALVASTASAESGVGEYKPEHAEVLAAAHVRRLSALGEDVVRFSSTPALGGRGWIVELHRTKRDRAEGVAEFYRGHPSLGWTKAGSVRLEGPKDEFDRLAEKVRVALARGEPDNRVSDEIVVCTDGPGYVTEQRQSGRTVWTSGFCNNGHPNNEIAELMLSAITRFGPMPAELSRDTN